MKKTFISAVMCAMLMLGSAFMPAQSVALEKEGPGMYQHSVTGAIKYFDSHPGLPSQWNLVTPNGGDNGCGGYGCYSAGDFYDSVFAKGGGLSGDIKTIPNGIALGGGIAGGEANGYAYGYTDPYYWYGWNESGSISGDVGVLAGGVTKTVGYSFNPNVGDIGIGVGSFTHNIAQTGGFVKGAVEGNAYTYGNISGQTGQQSINLSALTGSPISAWESTGLTYGIAGQESSGNFYGYGGVYSDWYYWYYGGEGSYDLGANIFMSGASGSDSWRAIDFFEGGKTEYMGTNVFANTLVETDGFATYNSPWWYYGGAYAYVDGGFSVSGDVTTNTGQAVNGGTASAHASGGYTGYGSLNCNFLGSAVGYSQTSATTLDGYNGSIMGANAGMTVSTQNSTGSIVD